MERAEEMRKPNVFAVVLLNLSFFCAAAAAAHDGLACTVVRCALLCLLKLGYPHMRDNTCKEVYLNVSCVKILLLTRSVPRLMGTPEVSVSCGITPAGACS